MFKIKKEVHGEVQIFQIPSCQRGNNRGGTTYHRRRIQGVNEFWQLGNVLDCEVSAEQEQQRSRTKMETYNLLTNKTISLKIRGSVWLSCDRSVMLYGTETWAMKGKIEEILKS